MSSLDTAPDANPAPAPRETPLAVTHEGLGAHFTDFGGWRMPLRYGSELAEHHAVRQAAGLFDLSHMGEVWVDGPEAAEFLDHVLVGRLQAVPVGRAKYSLLCAEDGGVLDDLIAYRVAEDRVLVVPNASNTETVVAEFRARAEGFAVAVHDASAETALLAVQGPRAADILRLVLAPEDVEPVLSLRYYAFAMATVAGHAALVARTGYTGEDGFELFVPGGDATALWRNLTVVGEPLGLAPCGLAARDSLRLEAGMPLYGHELTRDTTPFAAGLGGAVALDKVPYFVGRFALAEANTHGEGTTSGQRLVGLQGTGRRAPRPGYVVRAGGTAVGHITSGQLSPTLGMPIAMALVDVARATPGTALAVDVRGSSEPVEVVPLPFYRRPR